MPLALDLSIFFPTKMTSPKYRVNTGERSFKKHPPHSEPQLVGLGKLAPRDQGHEVASLASTMPFRQADHGMTKMGLRINGALG